MNLKNEQHRKIIKWKLTEDTKILLKIIKETHFTNKIIENEFIHLFGWHERVERENRLGLLSKDYYTLDSNKVKKAFIDTIDLLNETDSNSIIEKLNLKNGSISDKQEKKNIKQIMVGSPARNKDGVFYLNRKINTLLLEILNNSSGNIILLNGPRRYGKTSSLYNTTESLNNKEFNSVYIDCSSAFNKEIYNALGNKFGVKNVNKNFREQLLQKLNPNCHTILMLDEFGYFYRYSEANEGQLFLNMLKQLRAECLKRLIDLTIILTSEDSTYQVFGHDLFSIPFINLNMDILSLKNIKSEFDKTNFNLSDNQLVLIHQYTGGIPFLINLLIDKLFINKGYSYSEEEIIKAANNIINDSNYLAYTINSHIDEKYNFDLNNLTMLNKSKLNIDIQRELISSGIFVRKNGQLKYSSKIHEEIVKKWIS